MRGNDEWSALGFAVLAAAAVATGALLVILPSALLYRRGVKDERKTLWTAGLALTAIAVEGLLLCTKFFHYG